MNLRQMTFWLFLFLLFPTFASAQQATKADIQALEAKITNLETTVREMDKRLTAQIQAVQTIMTETDKRLTNQISELDKRLSAQINVLFWAIGALVAVVLAVIALPQLLGYFQEKRARVDFQKRIEQLEQRLEQYHHEIETLKSQRIVTPS
jgi:peptidoglycan hydrolase CwlO-like protein